MTNTERLLLLSLARVISRLIVVALPRLAIFAIKSADIVALRETHETVDRLIREVEHETTRLT